MDALVSIECRSARGIRAGVEREWERFLLSVFLSSPLLCGPGPVALSLRLWAGVVDSFGAVKSPESVRLCDRGRGGGGGGVRAVFPPSSYYHHHHAAGALG